MDVRDAMEVSVKHYCNRKESLAEIAKTNGILYSRDCVSREGADAIMAEDVEATAVAETPVAEPLAAVPGLGNVTPVLVRVGPQNTPTNAVRLTITGLQFTTDFPSVVLLSPRQGPDENQDFGSPDEFAVQVIRTAVDSILCRILRIDTSGTNGWGQNLHLSGLVVD